MGRRGRRGNPPPSGEGDREAVEGAQAGVVTVLGSLDR
jgi:hypothetical protein